MVTIGYEHGPYMIVALRNYKVLIVQPNGISPWMRHIKKAGRTGVETQFYNDQKTALRTQQLMLDYQQTVSTLDKMHEDLMSGTPKSLQDHLIKLTMLNAKIKAESNPIKQLELYLSYLKQVNKSLKTFPLSYAFMNGLLHKIHQLYTLTNTFKTSKDLLNIKIVNKILKTLPKDHDLSNTIGLYQQLSPAYSDIHVLRSADFQDEQKLSINQNQLNKVAEIKMKLESLKSDIQKANKKNKNEEL